MSKDWIQIETCKQANDRVAAMVDIEAMKAENQMMVHLGKKPKYEWDDFNAVKVRYDLDYTGLLNKKKKLE